MAIEMVSFPIKNGISRQVGLPKDGNQMNLNGLAMTLGTCTLHAMPCDAMCLEHSNLAIDRPCAAHMIYI